MYIEELKAEEAEGREEPKSSPDEVVPGGGNILPSNVKRVLVGVGARALFYPTLLYNVVRNKIEPEFHWWDKVDEFILLGAVPFPVDVPLLKELGVHGVITLNESYETLVSPSLYDAYRIDHLVIPTRDYCFAPNLGDICHAVDFIHVNASCERTTYVHCKAGRGRSTTIVICYLVHHKQMTPNDAYDYIKSIRPRVLLAASQWEAVLEYYHLKVKKTVVLAQPSKLNTWYLKPGSSQEMVPFDDGLVVVVTKSDLEGYEQSLESDKIGNEIWADLSVVYRVRVAGQAAMARISCRWLRCRSDQKMTPKKLSRDVSCSMKTDHLGGINVDIHVY